LQKPEHLLAISPKGTVPVLQLPDSQVIDESMDIMHWALAQNDPEHWLDTGENAQRLIQWNDGDFKYFLDRYKYADRYPEFQKSYYRSEGEKFLSELENKLSQTKYLSGNHFSITDAAIFPFIRQFVAVDNRWFDYSGYQHLYKWLSELVESDLFASIMAKNQVWKAE
jgi:glutathione S-transferase